MQDRRAPRKEADRRTSSPDRVSTVRARAADTHVALVTHDPFRNSGLGERAVTFRGKISACLEMSQAAGRLNKANADTEAAPLRSQPKTQ
jgi:hypothetical protein